MSRRHVEVTVPEEGKDGSTEGVSSVLIIFFTADGDNEHMVIECRGTRI